MKRLLFASLILAVWLGSWMHFSPRLAGAEPDVDALERDAQCEAMNRAAAVFTGKVTAVEKLPPAPLEGKKATFEVTEVLAGEVGATAQVYDLLHCARIFRPGEALLVYAYQTERGLRSMCIRTTKLARAKDQLTFLRARKALGHGSVFGTVTTESTQAASTGSNLGSSVAPRAGLEVRVKETQQTTRTDAHGRYRFDLPLGTHTLEFGSPEQPLTPMTGAPSSTSSAAPHTTATLHTAGGCEERNVHAPPSLR